MNIVKFLEKNTRSINRPIIKLCHIIYNSNFAVTHRRNCANNRINRFLETNNIEYFKIRNKEDYKTFEEKFASIINYAKELGVEMKNSRDQIITVPGFCIACGKNTDFVCKMLPLYSEEPLLSETVDCSACGCANRTRALLFALYTEFTNRKNLNIYVCEQVTYFYKAISNLWGYENNIIGSEYLGEDIKSGTLINGIRHEDAANLSFENDSLDAVVSNHVYEHVFDIDKTLNEAFRVLKKGGKVVAGIPFDTKRDETFTRACIEDGKIKYLAQKEIHGNPLSEDGCLCVYNFGWDLLEKFKNAGFKDVYFVNILNKKLANIVDYPVATFVAVK